MDNQYNSPVIGIDLGGTQLRVAIMRGAEIISRVSVLTGPEPTPDRVIPHIHSAIQQALVEATLGIEDIAGIGIGVAGLLDSQTGVVFASPNLEGWHDVPLLAIFKEKYASYKMPIYIENDANAAGLGEYMFGAGQGSKNFVYLTISTGIGGCVIVDGHLLKGTSGTAAELGHMVIDWQGEQCNCGNMGCLESIASGTAIARSAQKAVEQGTLLRRASQVPIDSKEVGYAAKENDPIAKKIIQRAAEALGIGLVNIIHIFNPEIIALGGGVTQIGSLLLEPAQVIVQQRAMKVPASAARITIATLGVDVGLIGAGALVYLNKGVLSQI